MYFLHYKICKEGGYFETNKICNLFLFTIFLNRNPNISLPSCNQLPCALSGVCHPKVEITRLSH